jgi:hypothetical protein
MLFDNTRRKSSHIAMRHQNDMRKLRCSLLMMTELPGLRSGDKHNPRGYIVKHAISCACLCVLLAGCKSGSDATAVWSQILSKCATSNFIGSKYIFFGVSNSVGPGSGWRITDDKSLRLLFRMEQPFPANTDVAAFVAINPIAQCQGDSTTDWDLGVALPFAVDSNAISGEVAATLRNAKSVKVSITGFSTDLLTEVPWLSAFQALPADNGYKAALSQPNAVLAENVVKVTGLKAVFTYNADLSADVQAKFKGKTFSVGDPGATSDGNGGSTPAAPNGGPGTSSGSTPSVAMSTEACTADGMRTGGGAPSSVVRSAGGAKFHADVTGARQIALCAPGPFYLLAAYSKLVGGTLGVAPGATGGALLEPAQIPKGVKVSAGLIN